MGASLAGACREHNASSLRVITSASGIGAPEELESRMFHDGPGIGLRGEFVVDAITEVG